MTFQLKFTIFDSFQYVSYKDFDAKLSFSDHLFVTQAV